MSIMSSPFQNPPRSGKLQEYMSRMYGTIIDDHDPIVFLEMLDVVQKTLRNHSEPIRDEEMLICIYEDWEILPTPEELRNEYTPRTWAQRNWYHEGAHRKASEEFGVRATPRLAVIADGLQLNRRLWLCYCELSIRDIQREFQDPPSLLDYLSTVLGAPRAAKRDLDYASENQLADRLRREFEGLTE